MLDTVSGSHVYDYDKLYQVTDVNYPPEFEYLDTVFDYDPVGNRTSVVDANGTDMSPGRVRVVRPSHSVNWREFFRETRPLARSARVLLVKSGWHDAKPGP